MQPRFGPRRGDTWPVAVEVGDLCCLKMINKDDKLEIVGGSTRGTVQSISISTVSQWIRCGSLKTDQPLDPISPNFAS